MYVYLLLYLQGDEERDSAVYMQNYCVYICNI